MLTLLTKIGLFFLELKLGGLEMPQELWIIRNDKFLSQPCFEDKHHKTLKKNRNMREMPTFLVHHDVFPGRLLTIWDWPHFKERI
jgi:hypothetical protein